MNYLKLPVVFVVGVAIGALGGGFVGYTMGHSNNAIDRAIPVGIVEVGEERRPVRPPRPAAETAAEAAETDAAQAVAPVESEVVPEAAIEPEPEPAIEPEPELAVEVEEFEITPNDYSEIMWVGYKSLLGQRLSMEGGFANFEGTITVENNDPNESFVELIVDINQIFSENAILTTVLKGDQFFDVENHPTARFASTKIEPADEGYLVTGNFTMRGVTQGIQFPATIERRDNGVYVKAEFTIDRKQWEVGYDAYDDSVILPEVVISFDILADPV